MILIKPSFEILEMMGSTLELIELAGRTCYKSEDKINLGSAEKFVKMIRDRGHHSVIEHSAATVKVICDRGVTHEIVRHRLCAYSQESTQYCNYKGGVTFVIPPWCSLDSKEYKTSEEIWEVSEPASWLWARSMLEAEINYIGLIGTYNWSPQQARSVLPNSLKTEIVITANFREWLHIFNLRCSKAAHPQMREIMIPLCKKFQERIPIIFNNVKIEE